MAAFRFEAASKRVHQVDNFRRFSRLRDDRLLALYLLLGEMGKGFLVTVASQLLGIEVARFLLDEGGKIDHFLVELALADLLEIFRVSPNLVPIESL